MRVGFALGGGLAVVHQAPRAFLQAYHAEFAAVELVVDVAEHVPDYPVAVAGGVAELVVAAVVCHGIEERVEAFHDFGAGVLLTGFDFDEGVRFLDWAYFNLAYSRSCPMWTLPRCRTHSQSL